VFAWLLSQNAAIGNATNIWSLCSEYWLYPYKFRTDQEHFTEHKV